MKTHGEEEMYKKCAAPGHRPSRALIHCNPANCKSRSLSTPPSLLRLLRDKRILCVDDEIVGTTIRAETLKEHGYAVFCIIFRSQPSFVTCSVSISRFWTIRCRD